jgi:hypothetical protein
MLSYQKPEYYCDGEENSSEDTFTESALYFPSPSNPVHPLLPTGVASLISSFAMASRFSLRMTSVIVENLFESLKFSASASLGVGRRALVSAVSSARMLHLLALKKPDPSTDALTFYSVLDAYTHFGVSIIHNSFSLAELLTLTTFHLTSSTIKFSLETAEECVHVLDGLFGETETSKALAAMIQLFFQEWQGQDDALGLSRRFGRFYALGQITKAMTAYCCLQFLNRKRWRTMIKLHPIYLGQIVKPQLAKPVFAEDMLLSDLLLDAAHVAGLKKNSTWGGSASRTASRPTLLRRYSLELEAFGKEFTPGVVLAKKDDVFLPAPRRRCKSGPHTDTWVSFNTTQSVVPDQPAQRTKITPMTSVDVSVDAQRKQIALDHVKLGARYVKFAVGAYGSHFLKIMG